MALDAPEAAAGCEREHQRLRACVLPCLYASATHTREHRLERRGRSLTATTELTRAGCALCPVVRGGAPPGSPCQNYSVCQPSCCACSDSRGRFVARACVEGRCAAPEESCQLALEGAVPPLCARAKPVQR